MALLAHYDLELHIKGCENCLSYWRFRGECLHGPTNGFLS